MKKQLATIALIGISLSTIFAQELVKDINPNTADSEPRNFSKIGDKAFFVAEAQGSGIELWTTDGTEAGTVLLKDIDAGNGQGVSGDVEVLELNGNAIFSANDGSAGKELWISDGTTAGTNLLKEIHGSPTAGNGSFPKYLTKMGNEIFFNASDKFAGVYNEELWKTDGTAAGTVMVKEINTSTRSRPEYLTEMNGKIYFSADDGTGKALWATDGTDAGTVKIKSNSGGAAFSPQDIIKMGDEIFFNAYDSGNNNELWKSDGTEAGTVLVKDIASGPAAGSEPDNFIVVENTLYFKVSGGDLWKTDGTNAGTVLVTNSFNVFDMISFKDVLYFVGDNGSVGREIYNIDAAGLPQLVKDVQTGPNSGLGTSENFEVHGSMLYFSAILPFADAKLWQTDGTEVGTMEVPNAPSILSDPEYMYSSGNKLFFAASDYSAGGTGTELWVFDNLSSSELSETACPSYTYEGTDYTQTGDYAFVYDNALGYDSTFTLKLTIDCDTSGNVGISNLQEFEVNAFPNPLGNVLNISSEEKLKSISLVNINGAVIKSFNPSLKSFDVSTVSKGIYFLEVTSAEKKSIIKIIKK
ncbi:MAG: ELWxxDGT repeat protein [Chitinophagales bacterium]